MWDEAPRRMREADQAKQKNAGSLLSSAHKGVAAMVFIGLVPTMRRTYEGEQWQWQLLATCATQAQLRQSGRSAGRLEPRVACESH